MTVDAALQARFFLASLLAGLATGLFGDLLALLRIPLGASHPPAWIVSLYQRPLPLLKRSVGLPNGRRFGRFGVALFDATESLLLPLFGAILLVFVTFVYHDGVLRPLAVALFLFGYALWHRFVSIPLAKPLALFALGARILFCYLWAFLRLPFCTLAWLWRRFVWLPFWRAATFLSHKCRQAYTKKICARDLADAAVGFGKKKYYK